MERTYAVLLILLILLVSCSGQQSQKSKSPAIIPLPQEVVLREQCSFAFSATTQLLADTAQGELRETVRWAKEALRQVAPGFGTKHKSYTNKLILGLSPLADTCSEAYELTVTVDSIDLRANKPAGIFYGLQSLLQMLHARSSDTALLQTNAVPCLSIKDAPRFGYRGMHLDVSRNFFSKEFVKKYIDLLAMYKFNRFHWHLTDGAAWRIEIKKYPLLTKKAAYRAQPDWKIFWKGDRKFVNQSTPGASGGYYTQDDVRELVAYAAARHITVIPEIEMPGHSEEVFVAYPELSCSGKAYTNSDFCAGNEAVFTFLEGVLSEVIELFPSTYIHIGGDEAGKSAWKTCPKCKKRMQVEKLKDVDELQSYFVKRIERFLVSKNRKIIGWDEILQGGLAPEATVMAWRNEQMAVEAAQQGRDVIMSPVSHCYFDYHQSDPATQPEAFGGYTPLRKVYAYEPIPVLMPDSCRPHVLGAQGNVWTEYMGDSTKVEYMVLPRMIALAEVVWSPKEQRDWDDFKYRLNLQLPRLKKLKVNYYPLSYQLELFEQVDTVRKRIEVRIENEQYRPNIRYTTDGSQPTAKSKQYKQPFLVKGSAHVVAAIFKDGKLQKPVLKKPVHYHKAIGGTVSYIKPWSLSYPAGGARALIDGYRGGMGYGDNRWQGFTNNMEVVVDLGKTMPLNSLSATFMQLTSPGVYQPEYVEVALSIDGKTFEQALMMPNDISIDKESLTFKEYAGSLKGKKARYLRVKAKNPKGFIFTDELIVL